MDNNTVILLIVIVAILGLCTYFFVQFMHYVNEAQAKAPQMRNATMDYIYEQKITQAARDAHKCVAEKREC